MWTRTSGPSRRAYRDRAVQHLRPADDRPAAESVPVDRRESKMGRSEDLFASAEDQPRPSSVRGLRINIGIHTSRSAYAIDEVLGWIAEAKLKFVRGFPAGDVGGGRIARGDGLSLESRPVGSHALDHLMVQLKEIRAGNREGGFFLMARLCPLADKLGRTSSASGAKAPELAEVD